MPALICARSGGIAVGSTQMPESEHPRQQNNPVAGEICAPGSGARVVSLLPSATEMLCALPGGEAMLVGRSHECDHPASIADRPVLTTQNTGDPGFSQDPLSTPPERIDAGAIDRAVRQAVNAGEALYQLDRALLQQLEPDVILTQDVCRVCSLDVQTVRRIASEIGDGRGAGGRGAEVVSLDGQTVEGVLDDLLLVGRSVGLEDRAVRVVAGLRERMERAGDYVAHFAQGPTVAFLEWTDPLFIGGHWTPQLIERAGGVHPLNPTVEQPGSGAAAGPAGNSQRVAGKSVAVPAEVLAASDPEVLIIAPCGLTLEQTRHQAGLLQQKDWFAGMRAVREGRVWLVDGSAMFNRPGPRLVDAFCWLVGVLNEREGLIPEGFPAERMRV